MNEEHKTNEVSWEDDRFTAQSGGSGYGGAPLKKFLGEVGHTKRMMVIDKSVVMVPSHYILGQKRYVRCIADLNAGACPGCEMGKARERFGANVVVYETNKDGSVITPTKWSLQLWTFAVDKYVQIKAAKKEWGDLHAHDFMVSCTDTQFQRLTITVCKDALWMSDKQLMTDIATYFKEHKFDVQRLIGKVMSIQELKDFIAGKGGQTQPSAPQPGAPSSMVQPTSSPAPLVAPEAKVASPDELNKLLQDLGI